LIVLIKRLEFKKLVNQFGIQLFDDTAQCFEIMRNIVNEHKNLVNIFRFYKNDERMRMEEAILTSLFQG
jgi:hypothetical protein